MSEVLPEWGIKLRNLVNRIVPLVNTQQQQLHEQVATIQRLERDVAMLRTEVMAQRTTLDVMRAEQQAGR